MVDINQVKLEGTALKGSDIKDKKALTLAWKPALEYSWDTGVAIGRYLSGLKEGRIIARRCAKCERTMIPPRMFCELCFRPTDEWVTVEDTGRVNTFSICRINWDASRLALGEPPHIPAVIEIDGASPGMGILHLLGDLKPDKIKIGMKVKAVWRPADERTGAITDIRYFKPI